MNLFSNIFDQFTGKAQSQVPTSVPQAPRTSSYVAPNVPYTPYMPPVQQKLVETNDASTQMKQKY